MEILLQMSLSSHGAPALPPRIRGASLLPPLTCPGSGFLASIPLPGLPRLTRPPPPSPQVLASRQGCRPAARGAPLDPPPPSPQVLAPRQGCRPAARGAPPDPEHQLRHGGERQRPHRLTGHTPRHLNPVQHPRKLRAGLRSRTLPHQHDLWVLHTLTPLSQLPSEPASYIAPCPWPRLPPYPLGTATCQTLHCGAPWPAVGLIPPPPLASLNPLSPSPCPHYSLPGHAL